MAAVISPDQIPQEAPQSQRLRTLKRLLQHRSAVAGLIILGVLLFVAIFAPLLTPYEPHQVLIGVEDVQRRAKPCIHLLGCPQSEPQHIMGIDGNVRDVYTRVLFGSRISLAIGFITVAFALSIGTFLGAVAGYSGGRIDQIIMRLLDVVLAFPSLLLAIAIVSVLRGGSVCVVDGDTGALMSVVCNSFIGDMLNNSLIYVMLAVAIVTIPQYARVVRSEVIVARELEYVEASRALGATNVNILFRRILPNVLAPLIVQATLGVGTAILDAAALSFIGLGASPPTPEWGFMLAEERNQIFSAPHLVFLPGLAIMITVLAFNLLGDGLRDVLDPRLANTR